MVEINPSNTQPVNLTETPQILSVPNADKIEETGFSTESTITRHPDNEEEPVPQGDSTESKGFCYFMQRVLDVLLLLVTFGGVNRFVKEQPVEDTENSNSTVEGESTPETIVLQDEVEQQQPTETSEPVTQETIVLQDEVEQQQPTETSEHATQETIVPKDEVEQQQPTETSEPVTQETIVPKDEVEQQQPTETSEPATQETIVLQDEVEQQQLTETSEPIVPQTPPRIFTTPTSATNSPLPSAPKTNSPIPAAIARMPGGEKIWGLYNTIKQTL
jgi:hypothetical protein